MRALLIVACLWACAVTPAAAEVSSVDAYGGQAAVFGKHVRHRAGSGSGSARGTAKPGLAGEGPARRGPGGGSGRSAGSEAGESATSRRAGRAESTAGGSIAAAERSLLGAAGAHGGLPFGGVDVLLLVLAVLLLLAVAIAVRRLSQPSH